VGTKIPSRGERLIASTGEFAAAALASPYNDIAWKKL
jgi:hypothetical protein